jgi:hypothetical protein
MQDSGKRIKTHGPLGESDDEARRFMASTHIGPTDMGGLLKENWIHVLTQNPELSVDDILRMCRLNKRLKALCDTGVIWDEIYKRQFGLEDFAQALVDMHAMGPEDGPESKVALARLFTRRYELMRERTPYTNLLFADRTDGAIMVYLWSTKVAGTSVFRINQYGLNMETRTNDQIRMINRLQKHNVKIEQIAYTLMTGPAGLSQAELITGYRKIVFCAMLNGFFPRGESDEDTRTLRVGNNAAREPLCAACGGAALHQCDRCGSTYCGDECFDARPTAPYCGIQCENRNH